MKNLSVADTLNLLSKVIKGREDYIYAPPVPTGACVYWNPVKDQPSCIVGHVLDRMGVKAHRIEALDHNDGGGTNAAQINEVIPGLFSREASVLLNYIQSAQDHGIAWGEAVTEGAHSALVNEPELENNPDLMKFLDIHPDETGETGLELS